MNQTSDIQSSEKGNSANEIFIQQKAAYLEKPYLTLNERLDILQRLEQLLKDNQEEISNAISMDFGNRSRHETKILEIFTSISGLRYTRRQLKKWMQPQRRHIAVTFKGAHNLVIPQAKGIVGIIAPWNYPLLLVISPLTSALAAGNRCMIKMAANSQRLCNLLHGLFSKVFGNDLIAILPGVSSNDFTPLPFDHLVFTGSTISGRIVMKTAAENLTPVTLELGGKSPTIMCEDFDLRKAAERILYTKFMNSGQTCIAPDYLFLPKHLVDDFIKISREIIPHRYCTLESVDYTSIINAERFNRLVAALDDARSKGAELVSLIPNCESDEGLRKIQPFIVLNVTDDMDLMQNEIFGPILPIKPYTQIDQCIQYIKAHERPLALYLFTKDRALQEKVLMHTMSGGVCLNDCAMHIAQHDMPFGGIGHSGMGQYHGYEGFLEFSKLRPVFIQAAKPFGASFLYPPYGKAFKRMYNLIMKIRWF